MICNQTAGCLEKARLIQDRDRNGFRNEDLRTGIQDMVSEFGVETASNSLLLTLSLFIVVCVGLATLSGCGFRKTLPAYEYERNCYAVMIADGPEDFVLDKWNGSPRLLISSHERRQPAPGGEIIAFDLKTGYSEVMPREQEPERLRAFKPHGVDIRTVGGKTDLYVIVHDPYAHDEREENAIAVYRVYPDRLVFRMLLENPRHLWSPNDLSVLENGDIYVTNDYRHLFDVYFKRGTSEVVYYDAAGGAWSVVADNLAFANGVLALQDRVYVSVTREDKIVIYPRLENGRLGTGRVLATVKGPDNIMLFGDQLLVAAHLNDFAFMSHHRNAKNKSPSVVYLINPSDKDPTETMEAIYVDDGGQISAASTAFVHNGKLYVSQVFDSHLLICDADDL